MTILLHLTADVSRRGPLTVPLLLAVPFVPTRPHTRPLNGGPGLLALASCQCRPAPSLKTVGTRNTAIACPTPARTLDRISTRPLA